MIIAALLLAGQGLGGGTNRQDSVIAGAHLVNPNTQVSCVTIDETGSRLSRHRVCMTRAAWAEHDRETRRMVTEAQTRQLAPTELTAGQVAVMNRATSGAH